MLTEIHGNILLDKIMERFSFLNSFWKLTPFIITLWHCLCDSRVVGPYVYHASTLFEPLALDTMVSPHFITFIVGDLVVEPGTTAPEMLLICAGVSFYNVCNLCWAAICHKDTLHGQHRFPKVPTVLLSLCLHSDTRTVVLAIWPSHILQLDELQCMVLHNIQWPLWIMCALPALLFTI
jgi:hypothetical protein